MRYRLEPLGAVWLCSVSSTTQGQGPVQGWVDADLRCFPLEGMSRSSPKWQDSTRHGRLDKIWEGVK